LRPNRGAALGFVLVGLGVASTSLVVDESWPLAATFATWCLAGLGMGFLFVPTSVAAMTHAEDGRDGVVASQVNLADSIGFSLMGGLGGASVAVADRGDWTLRTALIVNFSVALGLAMLGLLLARRIRSRSTPFDEVAGTVPNDIDDRGIIPT